MIWLPKLFFTSQSAVFQCSLSHDWENELILFNEARCINIDGVESLLDVLFTSRLREESQKEKGVKKTSQCTFTSMPLGILGNQVQHCRLCRKRWRCPWASLLAFLSLVLHSPKIESILSRWSSICVMMTVSDNSFRSRGTIHRAWVSGLFFVKNVRNF